MKRTILFLFAVLLIALPVRQTAAQTYTWTVLAGKAGVKGSADGPGSTAQFNCPFGVAVDTDGSLIVADTDNHTIRKISAAGIVTTLAGSVRQFGSADGKGSAVQFCYPCGVAVDSTGHVIVADTFNHTIRKVSPDGVVTTLAGAARNRDYADGAGSTARFNGPRGVAIGIAANLIVADSDNHAIRKVSADGVVTTLAGIAGNRDYADGVGSAARFRNPVGLTLDCAGNVFIADTFNHTIRKVSPSGVVTTLAGSAGEEGSADGTGSAARFGQPFGVAVDKAGNVFVADTDNHAIRKVSPAGMVTTIGSFVKFARPQGIAVDSAGNLYVADWAQHCIFKGTPSRR